LTHAQEDVTAMRSTFRGRRDVLCDALEGVAGIACERPAGGMFVMADIRATGLDGDAFAQRLLDAQGVSVLSGDAFGPSTRGYVRIGLTQTEDRLAEAARRIAAFTKSLL
jgi:arginine:pyruvate transaminase